MDDAKAQKNLNTHLFFGLLTITIMNSLIKYGLYFVVAFSVLAFGAAEVWAFSVVEFVVFLLVFLFIVGIGIKS
jgi:hypothetical protein